MGSARWLFVCASAALAGASIAAPSAPPNLPRAIYTKIPKHPTAVVPGARDASGNAALTFFKSIENISVSPDGSRWSLTGRTTQDSSINIVLMLGSGTTGSVLCQEGQPFRGGLPGEQYFFFQSPNPVAWNNAGGLVFTARARNGLASKAQKVVRVVNGVHTIIHQQGDPALGMIDDPPSASGNETFGQDFTSLYLFDSGTASFRASINNCANSRWPAIFHGNTSFRQSGVSLIEGEFWDNFVRDGCGGTPDGAHWFAAGAVSSPDTFTDDILTVDDHIVMRESSPVGGGGQLMAHVLLTRMLSNGDWLSRGDDYDGLHWAVRNGELIARTYGDIAPGNPERWSGPIYAVHGNSRAQWVVAGPTEASDPARNEVIMLSGRKVVVREGDPVDLNGNGLADDDAFIGRGDTSLATFNNDNLFLTDDMVLYFIATLHNAAGQDLNTKPVFGPPTALLRMQLYCPADINHDGFVDGIDYDEYFNLFATGDPGADYNGDGFVDGIDSDLFNADFESGC